ncbi:MAG: dockerin type I repeat-containing protein [Clostridia bacterium]|nr:dockerin type I repeat-containing protein [Clostridia bacterium]
MRVAATVKNSGANRTASTDIFVYGAYFTIGNSVKVTAGDSTTVKGEVENIGYLDMKNVTVSATARSLEAQNTVLPTVKFMSGGHAYVLTEKKADLIKAITEGVSVNGKGIEYNALESNVLIDTTGCNPGEYEVILTVTCSTDKGEYTLSKTVSVTAMVPKAIMDITNLNLASNYAENMPKDMNPLAVTTSAAPGEKKTFSYRVVNLGTGNLTGLSAVLVDKNGCAIPWASLVMVGGIPSEDSLTTTVYPYFKGYDIGTAEGAARISVTFAPQEDVAASKYVMTLIVSADDVETVEIPMTVYVGAHAIGTKVIKVVTVDGTVVTDGKVTLYGPVSSAYSVQPIDPKSYTGDISDAVTVGSNLSNGGTVQFTNIPSGTYNISVTGNGLKAVTGQIEVLPIIDMVPEKIYVEQQLFVITSSSSTEKTIDSYTSKNQAYDDARYQLKYGGAYESEKPDIISDYPIDEMEIAYTNGKIFSRLAIMNTDMVVGNENHNVTDVTIRIESRDIPSQYIKFRSANGYTDTLTVGTLAPQQTYDFAWNLDLSALYIDAIVEKVGENYTLTLPEGCSWDTYYTAWDKENTGIDDYGYLTKHKYNKMSVSEDGRVLTVAPANGDVGIPDSRVPLHTKQTPKLYKFDIIIEGRSALEYAEGSLTEMKKITHTIPVQVDYIPNGYYLEDSVESIYTTERLEGAFSTGSNARAKTFSKKFLSGSGTSSSSTSTNSSKNNDGFKVGFSQDIITSEEHSKLSVGFDNPSNLESIEELEFKVIISDMMPDENGKIAPGASLKNADFYVSPSIVKANGVKGWDGLSEMEILGRFATSNGIDVGTLLANGSFAIDFDLEPLSQLYSNDMFTYLIDAGYMTPEEATEAAANIRDSSGASYAWVEYSFKRAGRTYTGITDPVVQNVQLPADITYHEEVFQLDEGSDVYYVAIVLTNSGFGPSDEIQLSALDIPSLNGERIRLASYKTGSMDEYPNANASSEELVQWYLSWDDEPVPEEIILEPIMPGQSVYVIYRLNVIGKGGDGLPTDIKPHPIELPKPPKKQDFKPVIYIGGKPVGRCDSEEEDVETGDPSRIAELIGEISTNLGIMMYSTVGDFGTRVEDAYTNAKMMQTAKVIVGVQKYLSFVSTVVANVLGFFGANTTEKPELPDAEDDGDGEKSLVDQIFTGTLLMGAVFDTADGIIGHIQPFKNALKAGTAKRSQVVGSIKQLENFGSLKPAKKVNSSLTAKLGELDGKISSLINIVNSGLYAYEQLVAQAGVSVDDLPKFEKMLNGLVDDCFSINTEITAQFTETFTMLHSLYMTAVSDQVGDDLNYYNYNDVQKRLLRASELLTGLQGAVIGLNNTVLVEKGHIMLNHYLRGDYDKDFDALIKKYKLETSWEAVKAAYENEDINENYLAKIFPKTADGIGKVKDVYEAKENFRSLKDKVQKFGTALGEASTKNYAAILDVLGNEGLELASEFDALKDCAEFVKNTMQLIQLANEQDEMSKAMGAFGDATLKLNYHTYEAVRNDFTTGALTSSSPLVNKLMNLIEEAIFKSAANAPGAFKPMSKADRKDIADYLVKYLNVQRAKYTRSEQTDSNWMIAHVSGVMAALFEQVYVAAITEQASPEAFLKYMQASDTKKTLNSYLDKTMEKRIFREVRKDAIAKLDSAKAIASRYGTNIAKNSSYPVKEIVEYLENLSQKIAAAANIDQISTRRYKDLNLWLVGSSTGTKLSIDTNFVMSFRDYQKALLNTDMINAENAMVVVNYWTAAMYDLIVRSALLVVTLSPNAISASLGATATSTWDGLAEQVFTKLDDEWKQRSMLTAMSIADLAVTMGATVMKEVKIADSIYDLISALDTAVVFDPPLDIELVTYSVKDVVIPEGQATGTGEVLVTFRNDGDKAVAISPSVSIYTSLGKVETVDFNSNSILIPAGSTAEFIGEFTVTRSSLLDSTGYTAVLSYSASEPETVSIASEQGPFVKHFYAGTQSQINAMRNKVSAGTLVSGWVDGQDTLTGSITVKAGQSLRIFAAAPVNGKLIIEITSPSGKKVAAESFINSGDYAIINNCEAGTYTVSVTTPSGFDNRITVEGIVSSFDKAITDVHNEYEAVINCNSADSDGKYFTTVNFGIGESAGVEAGAVEATLDFEDENITAELAGVDNLTLAAGGAINGAFVIKAAPDTPAGTYTGTLKVSFDASKCDPAFLSLASAGDSLSSWRIEGDKAVYRAQIKITVDTTAPAAPEFNVSQSDKEGMVNVTGNAQGAELVVITYETDYDIEDDEGNPDTYTSTVIAAVLNPAYDGSFSIAVPKPTVDSRIKAVAVNANGGMSSGGSAEVSGYTNTPEENVKYADSFTSVQATQVEGKRDVNVTVYGAQFTGLTVDGDILYRVVEGQPSADYPATGAFDPAEWISAGAASSFTARNVLNGQYVEIVQVTKENVYSDDGNGNMTVTDVKYTVIRHGSVSVEAEEVPGYTVSGKLIPDNAQADFSDAKVILTDSSDSSVTYTADVQVSNGEVTYTFNDVVSGTYVLSLDGSKVEADDVAVTVTDGNVTVADIEVTASVASHIPGDINGDGKVNNKDLTRLFQYLSDWDVEVVDEALDVNGDGKINNKDLTRLFQYLSDWDVEIF